jgi:hypothetical protein
LQAHHTDLNGALSGSQIRDVQEIGWKEGDHMPVRGVKIFPAEATRRIMVFRGRLELRNKKPVSGLAPRSAIFPQPAVCCFYDECTAATPDRFAAAKRNRYPRSAQLA